MSEKVALEILIDDSQSASTLGDLRDNFKKLNEEIEKVETNSDEFKKLQQAITQTGKKVKNLELSFESLDKEQVATAIGGVAGGIGDVTNALFLMSGENEAIEVMVNNISNAMAVSMGLKGAIEGLADGYKLVNNLMKVNATVMRLVSATSKVLKVALISTGIGAIVVALGVLATNLDTVKNGFKSVGDWINKYFQPQIQAVLWLFNEVKEFVLKEFAPIIAGVTKLLEEFGLKETENQKRIREANEKILADIQKRGNAIQELSEIQTRAHETILNQMNREIALAKANGEDVEELERNRLKLLIERSKVEFQVSQQALKNVALEMKAYIELNNFKEEEVKELYKRLEEQRTALRQNREKYKDAENSLKVFDATIRTERRNKAKEISNQRLEDEKEILNKELEAYKEWREKFNAELEIQKQSIKDKALFDEIMNEQLSSLELPDFEEEEPEQDPFINKLDKRKEAFNKFVEGMPQALEQAQSSLNALGDLNNAFLERDLRRAGDNEAKKEQLRKASFEREKKLNIAKALLSGGQAIMQALASAPPPLNFALATGVGIQTALQIDAIKNTSYEGGGSTASLSVGSSTQQGLEGVGINPVTNTSTLIGDNKVYVTETDITTTQNAVTVIEEQSTF